MKIPLVAVFPPQAVSVASNVRLTIGPPKATMAMHHIGLGSWYGGRAVPLAGWFFWWRKNERQKKKMDENWGFWWNFLWYKMNWNQWYLGVKSEMIRKWPWNWRPLWEPRKMMKMMTNPSRRFWGVPLKFSQPNKYPILSYIRGWFFATSVYGVGDCFFFRFTTWSNVQSLCDPTFCNWFGNTLRIGVGIWGGLLGQDFVAVK